MKRGSVFAFQPFQVLSEITCFARIINISEIKLEQHRAYNHEVPFKYDDCLDYPRSGRELSQRRTAACIRNFELGTISLCDAFLPIKAR